MRTTQFIAAALLAVAGASAFAAGPARDYQSPTNFAQSLRTREAVSAETKNALASGDLKLGGDVVESKVAAVVAEPTTLTRAEVRASVAAARADHTLALNGELK
jgi:hypothetical protein